MPFLKGTNEEGEWFLYGQEPDGKPVRFKVRRISPGKEHEIERRHAGRKGELRYDRKKDESVMPLDRDADLAAEVDKAVWCLIDSENAWVIPLTQPDADLYAEAIGNGPVAAGAPLCLDGKWGRKDQNGRYPLKELFLSDELRVGRRIILFARELGVKVIEEEEKRVRIARQPDLRRRNVRERHHRDPVVVPAERVAQLSEKLHRALPSIAAGGVAHPHRCRRVLQDDDIHPCALRHRRRHVRLRHGDHEQCVEAAPVRDPQEREHAQRD